MNAAQIERISQAGKIWIFDLAKDDRTLELANPSKNLPYALWQFSWGGHLSNGYSGQLDVDVFKGTEAEFRSAFMARD